ncbi:DUF58 domain-containing protein [Alicyclobacillus vulcanalis]|nr:DUF58 domain-containing protein [Alicyclobacillus vulcanalis]
MLHGDYRSNRLLVPDETWFRGIRPYAYGDPVKYIDWRATAHLGHLAVREFFSTIERQALIILNAQVCEPYWLRTDKRSFESFVKEIVALTNFLQSLRFDVWFSTNSAVLGRKHPHYPVKLRQTGDIRSILAHAQPFVTCSLEALFETLLRLVDVQTKHIFLFSEWESDKQKSLIEQLTRKGLRIEIIDQKEVQNP